MDTRRATRLGTTILFSLALAACGGGGGGGGDASDGTDDNSASASVTNGAGESSFNQNSAVELDLENVEPNTRHRIHVTGPNGEQLSPDSGFVAVSDEDGKIDDHTIVQNLENTKASVTSSSTSGVGTNVMRGAAAAGATTSVAETGQYSVTVEDTSGDTVTESNFEVVQTSRLFCADTSGTARASFTPGQTVKAIVEGAAGEISDGSYDVFTVSDLAGLQDGSALAQSALVGQMSIASGRGDIELGTFSQVGRDIDVIVDINDNDTLDIGTDLISRPSRFHPCFTVQSATSNTPIVGQVASDPSGNYRHVFDPNSERESIRDVFAWVSPDQRSLVQETLGVDKYVVAHQDTWSDGDPLNDVSGGNETDPVQGFCINEAPWRVWARQSLTPGCYDIVIDVNRNGQFDAGTDFVDNIDGAGNSTCGFRVADPSCASNITIDSHSDGDTVNATRITLSGTVATQGGSLPSSGQITLSSGEQATTVNLSVDSSGNWSATVPLFSGDNEITVSFTYPDGTSCAQTISLTSDTGSADKLFRAQLLWDGNTDMDIHLVRPNGSYDNGAASGNLGDCNFNNCKVGSDGTGTNPIDWGLSGEEADDPKLDVDCIGCGEGVENVFMNEISTDGQYTVFVDFFEDSSPTANTETNVRVKIFVRGNQVDTVNCGSMEGGGSTDSCRVGTIDWSGGTSGNGAFTADGTKASDFGASTSSATTQSVEKKKPTKP